MFTLTKQDDALYDIGQAGAGSEPEDIDVTSLMIGVGLIALREWEKDAQKIPQIVLHGTLVSRVYRAMEAERRREDGLAAIDGDR